MEYLFHIWKRLIMARAAPGIRLLTIKTLLSAEDFLARQFAPFSKLGKHGNLPLKKKKPCWVGRRHPHFTSTGRTTSEHLPTTYSSGFHWCSVFTKHSTSFTRMTNSLIAGSNCR